MNFDIAHLGIMLHVFLKLIYFFSNTIMMTKENTIIVCTNDLFMSL